MLALLFVNDIECVKAFARILRLQVKTDRSSTVNYEVEYRSTSGRFSRWTIAQHPFRAAVHYGNRLYPERKADVASASNLQGLLPFSFFFGLLSDAVHAKPLSFTTLPLPEDVELVGSPLLHFEIEVQDCTEVTLFAYLEDVDVSSNFAHYVTEGNVSPSQPTTLLYTRISMHC